MPAAGEWSGLSLTSMGVLMRVDIMTLTTASAAALTIGLASPAFGAGAPVSALRAGIGHLAPAQAAAHQIVLARDGDGDGDGGRDGDVRGDVDQRGGDGDISGGIRRRHCGSPGCFHGFHHGLLGGPFVFGGAGCGIGCGGGWGGGGWGGGGDRTAIAEEEGEGGGGGGQRPTHRRPSMPMHMRHQVSVVPSHAVPTGFGGSQGSKVPLGLAGLSLLLGGAGLLVARRRLRTSARS